MPVSIADTGKSPIVGRTWSRRSFPGLGVARAPAWPVSRDVCRRALLECHRLGAFEPALRVLGTPLLDRVAALADETAQAPRFVIHLVDGIEVVRAQPHIPAAVPEGPARAAVARVEVEISTNPCQRRRPAQQPLDLFDREIAWHRLLPRQRSHKMETQYMGAGWRRATAGDWPTD
jgi:hypothetical protein